MPGERLESVTPSEYDRRVARACEQCGGPLALMARAHTVTCSPRCRKARSRARKTTLPAELTTRDRWVRRSSAKIPLTTAGMAASSTDPRTWSTHKDAADSKAGVGLGFVLSDVDDVVCIDLDHCLNPLTGRLAPWAAAILRDAGTTYVEVSPSGDGLHIWGRADVRQGRRIRYPDGTAVEIYGTGRYIAMTGRRHGHPPSLLGNVSAVVSALTRAPNGDSYAAPPGSGTHR
ncbi:bifunctional DNA primase/polymerase [Streptomyces sioyaensis]|uniref:bifunctional DNA primase/polymerase n=1 Tax=Streptomyces sioyaensis TaxID=67364 RepID=UPI0036B23EAB